MGKSGVNEGWWWGSRCMQWSMVEVVEVVGA